jgi:hypothetical protein
MASERGYWGCNGIKRRDICCYIHTPLHRTFFHTFLNNSLSNSFPHFQTILHFTTTLNQTSTMRCSTITALCTLLLPFTSAKCYNDSPKNTNKQFGLDNVNNSAKLLQGFLDAGQVRGVCVTDSKGGYSWYFSVRNTGKTGQTHSKAEIESYLRIEIQGCNANGGYSTHGKTQFK